MKIFNSLKAKKSWLRIENSADVSGPVKILMYEPVGRSPWDEEGVSAKDFKAILDQIQPRGREIDLRINCPGGDVFEGFAIRNMLDEYPGKVVCTVDGIAASTASWIGLGCDEFRASKNSQIFIHDAITFGFGNASDLRKAADNLDKTSDQIAGMYFDKAGGKVNEWRKKMQDETLMTGEEAMKCGLVDSLTNEQAVYNFTPEDLEKMKEKLKACRNSAAPSARGQTTKNIMDKTKIIALLAAHGVTVENTATDEQLQAALTKLLTETKNQKPADDKKNTEIDSKIVNLEEQIKTLKELNDQGRKQRVTNEIDTLINNDQLPAALKEKAIARALKDEEYINELKAMPAKPPGASPLSSPKVELTSEAFSDVQNYILENGPRFTNKFIGTRSGNIEIDDKVRRDMGARSLAVANAIAKNKPKIIEAWNANAIDAALQRQVILQDMLEAYQIPLLVLNSFATVYQNIPLEGTDKVEVPYFPLVTAASSSFVAGTGYTTFQDWTQNSREISVGGDGVAATSGANAAAGTARDRKFIALNFTSYDLGRQPYLNLTKLFQQHANKLGVDVFKDIVSRVITAANFGASVKAIGAGAFAADDVADLRESATGRNWPLMGRNLVLNHTYYTALLKDPSFKSALAYGSSDPIQQGRIQNAYGFENIFEVPNLTNYTPAGENLSFWINHKSAVLIAFANIMPAPAVRVLLEQFDIITDPKSGATFAHRKFANATTDVTNDVIESSYGGAKGVDAALARGTSQ